MRELTEAGDAAADGVGARAGTMRATEANTEAKQRREVSHRITAHRMAQRGQHYEVIADRLRVSARTVHRYLASPCPAEPPAQRGVSVEDFFMQGACGQFPELNWQSRSLLEQSECKAVCTYCPVLATCRTYGLTAGLRDVGIWGGMSRNERHLEAIARKRRDDDAGARGVA